MHNIKITTKIIIYSLSQSSELSDLGSRVGTSDVETSENRKFRDPTSAIRKFRDPKFQPDFRDPKVPRSESSDLTFGSRKSGLGTFGSRKSGLGSFDVRSEIQELKQEN